MIRLPVDWLFLGPVVLQLAFLLGCAVFYGLLRQTPSTQQRANIYRCTRCKSVYVDPRVVPLSSCPRCKTLNEAIKR